MTAQLFLKSFIACFILLVNAPLIASKGVSSRATDLNWSMRNFLLLFIIVVWLMESWGGQAQVKSLVVGWAVYRWRELMVLCVVRMSAGRLKLDGPSHAPI